MSIEDFRNTMAKYGLNPPFDILPDKWTRFPGIGKTGKNTAGYCFLFSDMTGGIAGDFASGLRIVWQAERARAFTSEEKIQFGKLIAEKQKEAAEKQVRKWAESARYAESFVSDCRPASSGHPYLARKGIKPSGALQHGDRLVIPMYQSSGKLAGYQTIDKDGVKLYNSGLQKTGACAVIDGGIGRVCVCEGFATGASIHEATGFKVLVAMDSGNLIHVAREAVNKYSDVLICADNDHGKESEGKGNAGIEAAKKILNESGVTYVYPEGIKGTDFNDMAAEQGLTAVAELIIKGRTIKAYEKSISKELPSEIFNPPGILKDIFDYYNATAVKPQPLFALAAGLAVGSIVLGRRYNTGVHGNYTALYMILAAKSGTGKDHVKQVVRNILAACGLQWMERGEGYTASNTVIKALEKQPLQISFFEEIGQRLQEAAANNRSSARGVFRKLLDVWSSCHSFCVGEEFSDGTVPRTERPSLTMIGLTTPRALTGAISEQLIEQGFVNRILPFISRQERIAAFLSASNGSNGGEVPDSIVRWIKSVWLEGNLVENGMPVCPGKEDEITVPFTAEAISLLNDIESCVVEKCNILEKIRLDDMLTRNREITMRISLITAVMDGCMEICPRHVEWSWALVNALYGQYVDEIKRNVAGSDYEKVKLEALTHLRALSPNGIRPRKMPSTKPWSQWPKKLRDEILADLKDSGLADIVKGKQSGKTGPKTDIWIAIENEA